MPKVLERKLLIEAKKKGFNKERTEAYVYGTMRKTGWTPSTQKKRKRKSAHKRKVNLASAYLLSKKK